MMHDDLRACLLPVVSAGVYFGVMPLGVVPVAENPSRAGWSAIVIAADMAAPDNTTCGASESDDHRVQIDLYSMSYLSAVSLRQQVFDAIESQFPTAYRVSDQADHDDDLKLHRRIIEYSIPD